MTAEGKLMRYHERLANFIKKADYGVYLNLLTNITIIVLSRQIDEGITSATEESLQSILVDDRKSVSTNSNSPVHKVQVTTADKILQLFESEFLNRNSFYFLMTKCFAEVFVLQYKTDITEITEFAVRERQGLLSKSDVEALERALIETKDILNCALNDIRDFDEFLREIVKKLTKDLLANKSEKRIAHLIHRVIFSQKIQIYDIFMDLIRAQNCRNELKLKENMQKLRTYKPQDFEVPSEFALPQENIPYLDVIDCLNFLEIFTTPQDKVNCIFKMKNLLIACYEDYLKKMEIKMKLTEIGGDVILPIIAYCAAKSGNEKLLNHLDFIEFFKRTIDINDEKDYYYTTLNAAIDYMLIYKENDFKAKKTIQTTAGEK